MYGWSHKKLNNPREGPVLERIAALAKAHLTGAMIIKEFLWHRSALLHVHSRHLWEFSDGGDPIRLHIFGLTHIKLDGALATLLGFVRDDLPRAIPPLYTRDDMEGLVMEMPTLTKRWLVGLHKGSPITVWSSDEDDNNQD
ncbi:hypothetical protein D1007_32801 [Hordeum vulgare]|nr:hypothetical protein D1007_60876 [Hordeum vulgare]KAE8792621.1 hypothetical protein D1007_32801 [Hordeum vulgare]